MMDDKLIRLMRVGVVTSLLLVAPALLAQPKAVKKKIEAIQENPVYKYGFAKGSTFDEAYKAALEKLVESIYVFVTSSLEQTSSHVLEQGKETVRLDKVNAALAMFDMEAVPGRKDDE